jgi:uncharacterized protein YcbK (DUF882 family)
MFFSRRTFLKDSLLATAAALLWPHRGWGNVGEAPVLRPLSLSLYNTHTSERLSVTYRTASGACDPAALAELDRLLRCHYTNEIHPIDPRTLDYLALLDRQLGGGHEIHIISGYRSPRYNARLQRQGRGVASNSLHLQGRALDLRIPKIELVRLKETAFLLGRGGIGYYPRSDFVHIDSGPVRSW